MNKWSGWDKTSIDIGIIQLDYIDVSVELVSDIIFHHENFKCLQNYDKAIADSRVEIFSLFFFSMRLCCFYNISRLLK